MLSSSPPKTRLFAFVVVGVLSKVLSDIPLKKEEKENKYDALAAAFGGDGAD